MEKTVVSPEALLAAGFIEEPDDPLARYKLYLCKEEDFDPEEEFCRPCLCVGSPRNVWEFFLIDIMGTFTYVSFGSVEEALDWASRITSFEPAY
jgi:hypothetical protein